MKLFAAVFFALLYGYVAQAQPASTSGRGLVVLTAEQTAGVPFSLDNHFLYQAGDDSAWADPAFVDAAWEQVNSNLHYDRQPRSGWNGTGWFRLRVRVDSSLRGIPLGFQLWQIGETEVYVNGELVYRSAHEDTSRPGLAYVDLTKPISLAPDSQYVLAIRHVNQASPRLKQAGYRSGFSVSMGPLESIFALRLERTRRSTAFEMFFLGGLLVLLVLHLMLYAFNPSTRENLYYAFFTAAVAFVTYNVFEMSPVIRSGELTQSLHRWNLAALLAPITGIQFAHVLFSKRTPWHFYAIVALGVALAAASFADPVVTTRIVNLYCVVGLLEFGRIIAFAAARRATGSLIIGFGAVILLAGTLQGLAVRMDLIVPTWNVNETFTVGVGALLLAMSVHLARHVARTNKDLRVQLLQVRELSATITEQEVQRRLLEAQNERKSQELEDARTLQEAMLPSTLPALPDLEIAASMRPANEVGGDYYDFSVADDGTLTVVIGDATGHGAKAGVMVTAAKSLFTTLAHEPSLVRLLHRFSSALRRMRLPQIYMALALLRVRDGKVQFASAGMPPLLIYRAATGEVEEVILKGMPLGGPLPFPYNECEVAIEPGDSLLLMSDGLPELFNEKGHMLGYDGASLIFGQAAALRPADIISHMEGAADTWAAERGRNDDMTFVVIRRTPILAAPAEASTLPVEAHG